MSAPAASQQPATTVQYRLSSTLRTILAARTQEEGSLNTTARMVVQHYDQLLDEELDRVDLTEAEATCLVAILNHSHLYADVGMDTSPTDSLVATVAGAFKVARNNHPTGEQHSSYAANYGINEQQLLAKITEWTPGQRWAVADAVHRLMLLSDDVPGDEALRAAGLVRRR